MITLKFDRCLSTSQISEFSYYSKLISHCFETFTIPSIYSSKTSYVIVNRSPGVHLLMRYNWDESIFMVRGAYEIATRFWEVVICPIYMCLTLHEFSFILFDLCLFITIFNFILNYVLIVTFWLFTYYKIWIVLIIYFFICNYWIFYFVTCLEVFWSVMS